MLPHSRFARLLTVLAVSGCLLAADDASKPAEQPHSPKARAAIEKHRSAADKLRAEYYTKLAAADEQLVKDLDAAMKIVASNGGDATEIERISAARKEARGQLQQDRDELSPVTYWLFEYATNKIWLKSDRTAVSSWNARGRWERRGNTFTIHWSGGVIETEIVSEDGNSFTGSNDRGSKYSSTSIGTNLTGAEPPPE